MSAFRRLIEMRWLMVLMPLVLVGCGPRFTAQHKDLDPDLFPAVKSVRVVSRIAQGEVEIRAETSKGGGASCGLLGFLVDQAITTGMQSRAEGRIGALRVASSGVDFREAFWRELERAFETGDWPTRFVLDTTAVTTLEIESENTLQNLEEDAVLFLDSQYFLSPHASVLVVKTSAKLYLMAGSKPAYFGDLTYYSDPIGPDKEDAAIERWAKNDARAYRESVDEGIRDTMRMIRRDLLERDKYPAAADDEKATFAYPDPEGRGYARWSGRILHREGSRLLVRWTRGNLYSLSSAWIKAR